MRDAAAWFRDQRASAAHVDNVLAQRLPRRFAKRGARRTTLRGRWPGSTIAASPAIESALHDWQVQPGGTLGYNKAEVTAGGVDTRELSSKTMGATKVAGLYFIGEVVDVTGWLGGYNFQWAWSSGHAAGEHV